MAINCHLWSLIWYVTCSALNSACDVLVFFFGVAALDAFLATSMLHCSWLMAQGSRLMAHASKLVAQAGPQPKEFLAMSHEPFALSLEP